MRDGFVYTRKYCHHIRLVIRHHYDVTYNVFAFRSSLISHITESVQFVANAKQQGKDPTETAQLLVKHALDAGSFDNITTIVVYLDWGQTNP